MAITFNQKFQPFNVDTSLPWYSRFNWRWFLQRIPIVALAIDSSYNIAKYIGLDQTPLLIQFICGLTFDLIFIGMVALADQFRSAERSNNLLFWSINGGAMLLAAIFGTLAYSGGSYSLVTPESFTRGVGFPVLGLLYNLFYHNATGIALEKERKEIEANPYQCNGCKRRFAKVKQLNGHMAQCQVVSSKD
jgi:hypothetical protein